jgi:hypothetical protein
MAETRDLDGAINKGRGPLVEQSALHLDPTILAVNVTATELEGLYRQCVPEGSTPLSINGAIFVATIWDRWAATD